WKNLIESGFPFLKVKTVRDHYPDVDVSDWREVLRSSGYDVSLAERAIAGATDETNHTMAYPKAPDHLGFREISGEQWSGTLPLTSIVRQGCTSSALSVLICTHELSESGAPRAAFDVARVLRDAGHYVVVASRTDGPYRERLCNIGVEVKVDDMLFAHDRGAIELGYRFDRIVCNTILCWPIVARLREVGQVYWYIHESELIHQLVKDIPALMPVLRSDVLFLVPSALSAGALAVYGVNARVIGYGVDDLAKSLRRGSV